MKRTRVVCKRSVAATFIFLLSSSLASSLRFQGSGSLPRQLSGTLSCPNAGTKEEQTYFEANILLSTENAVSCDATADKQVLENVAKEMTTVLDSFLAEDSVLGPLSVSDSCVDKNVTLISSSTSRRRLGAAEESSKATNNYLTSSSSWFSNWRRNLRPERERVFRKMDFRYRGWGRCRFCDLDDKDDRRRRRLQETSTTPITFAIKADAYPDEVSYKIENSTGHVIYSTPSGESLKPTLTLNLNKGETYTFVALDSYGDGWCCSSGNGSAVIYHGNSTEDKNNVISVINGVFEYESRTEFIVPKENNVFTDLVIPKLQEKLATVLTQDIWVKHENNKASCLYLSGPSVTVTLSQSSSPRTGCSSSS